MNTPHSNQFESGESNGEWKLLSEINLPRQAGAEKLATDLVAHIIEELHLPGGRLEQLKLAIASATLNAVNLKDLSNPILPISIRVLVSTSINSLPLNLKRTDIPNDKPDEQTNMPIKQTVIPFGWGFFLVDRTLESQTADPEGTRHRIELFIYIEGG